MFYSLKSALGTPVYEAAIGRIWPSVTKETIYYMVLKNTKDIVVLPVDIGWTDVGSWGNLSALLETRILEASPAAPIGISYSKQPGLGTRQRSHITAPSA